MKYITHLDEMKYDKSKNVGKFLSPPHDACSRFLLNKDFAGAFTGLYDVDACGQTFQIKTVGKL